ncbi:MAG: hypothetical protein AAFX94_14565, partial [Myxococcota bacterium]
MPAPHTRFDRSWSPVRSGASAPKTDIPRQRNRGDYNSSNLSVSESIVIHRRYTDLDYDIAVVS